jgi:hypothetical protein
MSKYPTSTLDRYLIDAGEMLLNDNPVAKIYIKPNRNITVADMQAALNAQYGRGVYLASSHGTARYVSRPGRGWWKGDTEVNSCEQFIDGSYVHKK